MKFEEYKGKIKSLDIETSGLKLDKSWIWSVGLSAQDKQFEGFVKASKGKVASMFTSSAFHAKQKAEGHFDDYLNALNEGKAKHITSTMRDLLSHIKDGDALIIQNVNFENSMLGRQAMDSKLFDEFADKMRYVSEEANGRFLYTPPQITNLRSQASESFRESLSARDPKRAKELFTKTNSLYQEMMKEYAKEIGSKSPGAFTIELMDVTKATYASAANEGLLSKKLINQGINVDFLSLALLGRAEKHTALDDAGVQRSLFFKLASIQEEMASGNVSEDTKRSLAAIRAAQPFETSLQFVKSSKRILEEIETNGVARIIDPGSLTFKSVDVNKRGGGKYTLRRPNYDMVRRTDSAEEALSSVMSRYASLRTPGLNKDSLVGKVLSKGSNKERIEFLNSLEGKYKEPVTRALAGQSTLSDAAVNYGNSIKDKVGRMSTAGKAGLALAGIGVLAYAISDSESDKQKAMELERRQKKKDYERSTEVAFKTFSKPINYHGTGFYLWENAIGHHEY